MVMHLRPLKKKIFIKQRPEFLGGNKIIIQPLALPRPFCPGRVGDNAVQARNTAHKTARNHSFSYSGRTGENKQRPG